jgi:hypothetical protein
VILLGCSATFAGSLVVFSGGRTPRPPARCASGCGSHCVASGPLLVQALRIRRAWSEGSFVRLIPGAIPEQVKSCVDDRFEDHVAPVDRHRQERPGRGKLIGCFSGETLSVI